VDGAASSAITASGCSLATSTRRTDPTRHPDAGGGPFAQRVKAILRVHLRGDIGRTQRNAGDHPVAIALPHGTVGVPRLMRAVERADAEVDDPHRLRGAVVAGTDDIGGQAAGGSGGKSHQAIPSGQSL
jgi:hypothetical protein